jgi:hypothetical protein
VTCGEGQQQEANGDVDGRAAPRGGSSAPVVEGEAEEQKGLRGRRRKSPRADVEN